MKKKPPSFQFLKNRGRLSAILSERTVSVTGCTIPAPAASCNMESRQNGQQDDCRKNKDGRDIHLLKHNQIGQIGAEPGNDTLEQYHKNRPQSTEFPLYGGYGSHTGCIQKAENKH